MIRILSTDLHVLDMRTRMPFRYGVATLTALPHLLVRVEVEVDGRRSQGVSADGLPPKWFTKDPDSEFSDEVDDMLRVIETACAHARSIQSAPAVFDLWQKIYSAQKRSFEAERLPPLLWGFGVSLVERAVIDAFCRATDTPFARAVRRNTLGIRLGDIHGN